jgi:hypothetical protein
LSMDPQKWRPVSRQDHAPLKKNQIASDST